MFLLEVLQLHSFEYRQISYDLVLCYKILNSKLDTDLANVLKAQF